ncbi:hypothetical protein EAF00_008379 [Botryotinia globosa]|nr:hypothetical protein EAF00_008379 [Botryotinia globosa]
MSYNGSNAGRDRSVSHRSGRDDNEYAPLPHHNDRDNGSIAHYGRTVKDEGDDRISTTSVRVKTRGPPISYYNKYGNDETRSHRSRSISRGGDESPERHRPLQRKTGSHSGSKRAPSVSSDRTARPSIPRDRQNDTDSQAIDTQSYTSTRRSHTSRQYNGYTPSHHDNQRSHRGRSASELAGLSKQTESLSLGDPNHDRVARWSKGVEPETGGDWSDDDPTTELRSVNREGSNAPSSLYKKSNSGRDRERFQSDADRYSRSDTSRKSYIPPPPGSFTADFPPNDTRSQSHALALQQYRDDHAPRKARSHRSYDNDGYASSVPRSHRPRNPSPSYGRDSYVDGHHNIGFVDLAQTHVNVTTINGPSGDFMGGPSKRELRRMEKEREYELDRAMIDRGMIPPPRKGFWD